MSVARVQSNRKEARMLHRIAVAGFIAAALVTAPPAGASKPVREPLDLGNEVLPACSFDVGLAATGRQWQTTFDSGRISIHTRATPTLTNLDDAAQSVTYLVRDNFEQTVDPDTGAIIGRLSGQ